MSNSKRFSDLTMNTVLRRYAAAILAALVALVVRALLQPALGTTSPYVTLFAAIGFSAWFCGLIPAILSTLIGVLGAIYFFIPPLGTFSISDSQNIARLAAFLFSASVIIVMGEANRRSRAKLDSTLPELRQSRAAANLSEGQFQLLANSIPELCWMASPDGHIFWYNQRWYEYTGTTPQQMEGWGWQKVHDPAVLPAVVERWKNSLASGEPMEMVFPLKGVDGVFRSFLTRVRPLKDTTGRVTRWFGSNTDISSQMSIEAALRENEKRLRAAFSQTYSFMFFLTVDGTVIDANGAALGGAEFKREEVVGKKFWEPWWSPLPAEVEKLKAAVASVASGETVREEGSYALRDGTVRFADRTLTPVKDDNGQVVMIVATGMDITEQKELRDSLEERVNLRTRELREKNQELFKQSEIVRELSGRVLRMQDEERRRIARELHDSVGQLLSALGMNFSIIASSPDLTPAAAKAVAENATLLNQILSEIRTISHLLHPPLLDEIGLQSALKWYVEGYAERSKIKVNLELAPKLGRLSREAEISIFRVVQESLTNIHRHSQSPTATVRLQRDSDNLRLEIEDAGKGITLQKQGALSHPSRTGVGIGGMRERLRQLGGNLELTSDGSGTRLLAVLPINPQTVGSRE
jgi:PAS domain S-box-containing protein